MLPDIFEGLFKCLWILGAAILGILYIVSPLDIIPNVIPVIGWLDDLGVVGWQKIKAGAVSIFSKVKNFLFG